MNTKKWMVAIAVLACAGSVMAVGTGDGTGEKPADQTQEMIQLQTSGTNLEGDQTRLKTCLPAEVQDAVKEMTQTRENYQQKQKEEKKECVASTEEEREAVREQLREQVKEQKADCEQLQKRLQKMEEALPEHQAAIKDACQEQVRDRKAAE